MSYQDDDGETTDILSDHDLTEAIQYFHAGADDNASANGSVLSGYSGRVSRRITLRIRVAVEYDGPSLSDTGSLVSLEDYPRHGHGSLSLSDAESYDFPLQEPDDDAVTISSHDTPNRQVNGGSRLNQRDLTSRLPESLSIREEEAAAEISLSDSNPGLLDDNSGSQSTPFLAVETPPTSSDPVSRKPSSTTVNGQKPEPGPDGVFERLRLLDSDPFNVSQQSLPLDANERGAQWLRDQTDRAAWHSFTTPKPSSNSLRAMADHRVSQLTMTESDFDAGSSSMGGDLELQKDDKGKYYYTFTADSSSHLESERDRSPRAVESALVSDEHHGESRGISQDQVEEAETFGAGPSTGAGLVKRVSQVSHLTESGESSSSSGLRTRGGRSSRLGKVAEAGEISPELLQAILASESQSGPQLVTDCSSCGDILDSFRYVCTTCGEKNAQTRESLALARSLSDDQSPTDPFADPSDSRSDVGLGLYAVNGSYHGQLMPSREEDIADARSEVSFATSSWASVGSPNHRQAYQQLQSSPAWPSLFKHSQDNRTPNEFPHSTFKQKLRRGFKRGTSGNSSTHGKCKDSSPVSQAPNATWGASAPPNSEWNINQPQPSSTQPTFRPGLPPRRPEVVIVGYGSNRSDSSGGSRSDLPGSNPASTTGSGYELCSKCIATAGVVHAESALSSAATPIGTSAPHGFSSVSSLGSSPHEGQHSPSNTMYAGAGSTIAGSTDWTSSGASSVSAPPLKKPKRKVQIRHAYLEKFWGIDGWRDVGEDMHNLILISLIERSRRT